MQYITNVLKTTIAIIDWLESWAETKTSGKFLARLVISGALEYKRRHEPESSGDLARLRILERASKPATAASMSEETEGEIVTLVAGAPNGIVGIMASNDTDSCSL